MFNLIRRILRSKKKNVRTVTKQVTFREIVEANNPEYIDDEMLGGVAGCPADYFYLNSNCCELSKSCKGYENCDKCWNQTMEVKVKVKEEGDE